MSTTGLTERTLLGRGGFATVHRVCFQGQHFAPKTIGPRVGRDATVVQGESHYELEMLKLLPVYHHHITRVEGTYRTGEDYHFLLSPVADEGSLRDFLDKFKDNAKRPSDNDVAILSKCFGCLTLTLRDIHESIMRHKDVKPENILIHHGRPIFSDFGNAHFGGPDPGFGRTTTTGDPGAYTPAYSAPEIFLKSGSRRTRKSDVFSLGAVLYEILLILEPEIFTCLKQPYGYYSDKIEEITDIIGGVRRSQGQSPGGNTATKLPMAAYVTVAAMMKRDQGARVSSNDAVLMLRREESLFCDVCWKKLEPRDT